MVWSPGQVSLEAASALLIPQWRAGAGACAVVARMGPSAAGRGERRRYGCASRGRACGASTLDRAPGGGKGGSPRRRGPLRWPRLGRAAWAGPPRSA